MTELDDPEALADAKIVADAFGIHYEPFKQGLIARARRERLQRILLRLLPIVAVCGVIAWFGFAAWKNSKIHVIDMSGAQVSIAELPDSTSVEASESSIRLTTEGAAVVDLGRYPSNTGVIRADILLRDSARCGVTLGEIVLPDKKAVLAVSVRRANSSTSPEVNVALAVHSFSPVGNGANLFVRQAICTAPAGFLSEDESLPLEIHISLERIAVYTQGHLLLAEGLLEIRRSNHLGEFRRRLGMVGQSGSPELQSLTFTTEDTLWQP